MSNKEKKIINNPNVNWLFNGTYIRLHVFEPEESVNKDDWYKDISTFSWSKCFENPTNINIGDIVEDNSGARFSILSKHWKWQKNDSNEIMPVLEFTAERYMRRGKQNPYML